MAPQRTGGDRPGPERSCYPGAAALVELMGVRPGETVLILSDARVDDEPLCILRDEILRHGAHPVVDRGLPVIFAEELPLSLEAGIRASDAVLFAASHSFYHTTARKRAKKEWGKRVAECYGIVTGNLPKAGLRRITRK